MTTTGIVRLPEERNMDRLIDIARFGARRDNVTVIIERTERRFGQPRVVPVLEVTPSGDVWEIAAPRLRTAVGAHMAEQHYRALDGQMNRVALKGHFAWERMVSEARAELKPARRQHA